MRCSSCKDKDLVPMMTTNGVEIDYCPKCNGIWLDKGEIYYFTKTPTMLKMSEIIKPVVVFLDISNNP